MRTDWKPRRAAATWTLALLAVIVAGTLTARNETRDHDKAARTLYVWAGDQARVAPDFLAVIDFDEDSPRYGKVIRTVPVPGPGASGNEPHHCNLSADKNILACGGLLALLKGQDSIFFFDVSNARHPRFLFSTSGTLSNITDDFLPLKEGGFLVTQMGSHEGGTPGRSHSGRQRDAERPQVDRAGDRHVDGGIALERDDSRDRELVRFGAPVPGVDLKTPGVDGEPRRLPLRDGNAGQAQL